VDRGGDAVKERRHESRQRVGSYGSQRQSCKRQLQPLPGNQSQYVSRPRAQRHANADLVCALRDGVGYHRIEPHSGEQQRDPGEHAHQCGHDPFRRGLFIYLPLHGLDKVEGQGGIDLRHLVTRRGGRSPRP
jgi:hypothetical protein